MATGEVIAATISAISGLKTIADGIVSMRDEAKVLEIKLALLNQMFEIRQAVDTLQDEIAMIKREKRQLEERNLELESAIAQRDDYEPFEVVAGKFVLARKPVADQSHQPPYACQACYSEGKLVLYQMLEYDGSAKKLLRCSTGQSAHHVIVEYRQPEKTPELRHLLPDFSRRD